MSELQSRGEHVLELAKELLDDIELGRLQADRLLLKATRLARLTGSDEIRKWLKYELNGYVGKDPVSEKYMGLTGRWTDRAERRGYWKSLAAIEGMIQAN